MFQCLTFPATILDAKRNSSKMEVGISLEEWLEDDENLKSWEDGKLTESDKRVLITKFVGSAWEKIFSRSDFSADIYFQRTGCLLTLNGQVRRPPCKHVESEDDLQLEVEEMAPGIERNFDNVIKL